MAPIDASKSASDAEKARARPSFVSDAWSLSFAMALVDQMFEHAGVRILPIFFTRHAMCCYSVPAESCEASMANTMVALFFCRPALLEYFSVTCLQ